jgi:hypothetical protein
MNKVKRQNGMAVPFHFDGNEALRASSVPGGIGFAIPF